MFFRHGLNTSAATEGYSSTDYDFVVMPSMRASTCAWSLAHQVGHYLGLPDTSINPTYADFASAQTAFIGDPQIFDGDGTVDTPPDPYIGADTIDCGAPPPASTLTFTNGTQNVPLWLPEDNVMSRYNASGALSLTDAKSYELWVLSQIGRDGSPITCDGLLDRSLAPGGSEAVRLVLPLDRNFDGSPLHTANIAPGVQNRVFYVDLHSAANPGGDIIGSGCAPSVTISAGSDAHVQLLISSPPAP